MRTDSGPLDDRGLHPAVLRAVDHEADRAVSEGDRRPWGHGMEDAEPTDVNRGVAGAPLLGDLDDLAGLELCRVVGQRLDPKLRSGEIEQHADRLAGPSSGLTNELDRAGMVCGAAV